MLPGLGFIIYDWIYGINKTTTAHTQQMLCQLHVID